MEQLNYNLLFRRCDLLGRDPPPLTFRPSSYDLELELLMQPDGPVIVAQRISKKGQRQLSRSAAAVAPAKAGRGMVEQVQPQRQWLGFLAVTDGDEGLSRYGIAVGYADAVFAGHCFAPLQKVQDRTVERRVFGHGALRCAQQSGSPQI